MSDQDWEKLQTQYTAIGIALANYPQPHDIPMDQIKLDPEVARHLSVLYAKVYECERTGGSTAEQARTQAVEAVATVTEASRPITLLPTPTEKP